MAQQLLKLLIQVDVELREKAGQRVRPDDYQSVDSLAPEMVVDCLKSQAAKGIGRQFRGFSKRAETKATTRDDDETLLEETETTIFGAYQLISKIGQGGMGSVWLAEQQEPIRRQVALKVIKTGTGSREILSRFEAERQALAMMNHPNIARILDAGISDRGQPFFAMELPGPAWATLQAVMMPPVNWK